MHTCLLKYCILTERITKKCGRFSFHALSFRRICDCLIPMKYTGSYDRVVVLTPGFDRLPCRNQIKLKNFWVVAIMWTMKTIAAKRCDSDSLASNPLIFLLGCVFSICWHLLCLPSAITCFFLCWFSCTPRFDTTSGAASRIQASQYYI